MNLRHEEQRHDDDAVDLAIAKALSEMHMDEREKLMSRIHGVDPVVKETEAFVQERTRQFQTHLVKVLPRHAKKKALQAALTRNGSYVESLILMFLRSETFEIAPAVEKMIAFFDLKAYLFGLDNVSQDITLDDLDKDDRAALKSGFFQQLPVRDRAGRAIWMFISNIHEYKVTENMSRASYYLIMSTLEDEETQIKGIVGIVYTVTNSGPQRRHGLKTARQCAWLVQALPFKQIAMHHCSADSASRALVKMALGFYSRDYRARIKMHHGNHMECAYALMTFGISPKALPLTMDGELKLKNHLDWIKMREHQEAMGGDKQNRILVPTHADVLFGRGIPFQEHVGNLHLHHLLDEHSARYDDMEQRREKSNLIAEIIKTIKEQEGGRFLKRDAWCVWMEVSGQQAYDKVGHAMRTRLRIASTSRRKANRQRRDVDDNLSVMSNSDPTEIMANPVVPHNLEYITPTKDLADGKRRKVTQEEAKVEDPLFQSSGCDFSVG